MTITNPLSGANRTALAALRDTTGKPQTSADGPIDGRATPAGPATVVDLSNTAKPVSQTNSSTKDFATVVKDARAAIDAVYAKGAKPFSIYTTAGEAKTMFADLDRRSLYAIKSNEGGQFTKDEQMHAAIEMRVRMDAATGQDQTEGVTDNGVIRDMFKRTVSFLDGVSEEEKGSFDWALTRARAQSSYETITKGMGDVPEKLDSTNPLVKMIKAAFDSLKELGDPSKQVEDMPLYKQAQQLFASQQSGAPSGVDIKA